MPNYNAPASQSDSGQPREAMDFCQAPSQQWLDSLEEWDGDPRSVEGWHVLMASPDGGFIEPWDSRAPDAPRPTAPED